MATEMTTHGTIQFKLMLDLIPDPAIGLLVVGVGTIQIRGRDRITFGKLIGPDVIMRKILEAITPPNCHDLILESCDDGRRFRARNAVLEEFNTTDSVRADDMNIHQAVVMSAIIEDADNPGDDDDRPVCEWTGLHCDSCPCEDCNYDPGT